MLNIKDTVMPILSALWQGRRLAMIVTWITCLLGWLTVALLPNVYTSTARLFVDTDTLLRPLMQDLAVTPDFDRQVEIMRDTLFAVPNVEELIERAEIGGDIEDPLKRLELIEDITDKLYLSVLGRNLFEIGYHHADPEVAHRVVTIMLDIFVQQQIGHSQRDVEVAGAFIDEQIASYDLKLRAAELRVAEFQREHAEELGVAARSVRDFDQAETDTRRLRSELESARWRKDQLQTRLDSTPRTVPRGQSNPALPSPAQQQLRDLSNELTRKQLLYTEQHPDIVALRQLIAQATEQVRAESEGGLRVNNPLRQDLTEQYQAVEISITDLERRLRVAENESQALSEKIRQAPQVEADLKRLNRDYDVLLGQYEQLTKRRESAQLARELDEGKKRIEFRTVEEPSKPLKPSGPPHGLFMLGVLIIGVGAGAGLVIFRFLISDTVLTTVQLQDAFPSLTVLGGVSELPNNQAGGLEHPSGLATSAACLVGVFVVFFYLYQLAPNKPELAEFAYGMAEDVISKNAKAEP